MARIEGRPVLKAEVVFVLTEEEAAALDALACYGTDQFLKVFYDHMGKAYLQPHEKGLRSLFASLRTGEAGDALTVVLERFKQARKVMNGAKVAVDPEAKK